MKSKTLLVSDIEIKCTAKMVKRMTLRVLSPDGNVVITVPKTVSEKQVVDFITSKLDWIRKTVIAVKSKNVKQGFCDGDTIIIDAKQYKIKNCSGKPNAEIKGDTLYIFGNGSTNPQNTVNVFLKKHLLRRVNLLLPNLIEKTDITPGKITVRDMKTRWGSCSVKTGDIRVNLKLVSKDDRTLEYLLLHEMIHIKVPNHGAEFKKLLTIYCPDWQEIRRQMKA